MSALCPLQQRVSNSHARRLSLTHVAAADCFDRLLTLAPDHIAGYQQAGKVLIAMNHIGRARRTLTAGIARADAAGQFHARDMMRQMLAALPEND